MTANEANGTDGQQRLMLEVAYEAMENGKLASLRVKTAANIQKLVFPCKVSSVVMRACTWDVSQRTSNP